MVTAGDVVAPVQITLGQSLELRNGIMFQKKHYAHHIPLEEMIPILMKTKDYQHTLTSPNVQCPQGWYSDFIDGTYYKTHRLVLEGKNVLMIVIYNDEAVMNNNVGKCSQNAVIYI